MQRCQACPFGFVWSVLKQKNVWLRVIVKGQHADTVIRLTNLLCYKSDIVMFDRDQAT